MDSIHKQHYSVGFELGAGDRSSRKNPRGFELGTELRPEVAGSFVQGYHNGFYARERGLRNENDHEEFKS